MKVYGVYFCLNVLLALMGNALRAERMCPLVCLMIELPGHCYISHFMCSSMQCFYCELKRGKLYC